MVLKFKFLKESYFEIEECSVMYYYEKNIFSSSGSVIANPRLRIASIGTERDDMWKFC